MLNVLQFSVIIDDAMILVDESDEKSNAICIYGFFIDFLYSICHIQTTCISLSTVFFSVVSGWDIRRKKTFAQIYSFHFVIAFNPFGNPIINYSNSKYYQLSTYSVFDQSMRTLVTLLISYYSDISWLLKGFYTIILGKIFALNIAFALNLKI